MAFNSVFPSAFLLFLLICGAVCNDLSVEEDTDSGFYSIEGKLFVGDNTLGPPQPNWQAKTKIHVNGGEFLGFVREDGSFTVHNVPSGSYIVEILNTEYMFEAVRIEINSKGKLRSRRVNHVQTSQVQTVPYPLRVKPIGRTKYFQLREQWRITDFLFNPMVLMMVLPLIIIMIVPKMLNDPETKKEMEQIGSLTKFEMPEVGDMVTNFFAGASPKEPAQKKALKTKKRQ